ncbi:unnamed protein product [Thlaspi arvense]|uniref:Uncharacterized protein n=1 Tax=Thlaspi arvense TaxID=13288 RepID=A0AAU9RIC5_THLAR|nr:unnamed protein product [Thlaspi arvense]
MQDLVVKSRSIVHPRNIVNQSTDRVKKINLTPWDLLRLRFCYPQRGLFFPKPDSDIEAIISKLKTSLSVALDHFYPLAGRLVKEVNEDDDTVSFLISCEDGSGVMAITMPLLTADRSGNSSMHEENVLKLKAKANDEAGPEEDGEVSSFQAALGHIWRSRVKHGGMRREEETHCRVPIDMRQRLSPKLKEDSFGNVIQTGINVEIPASVSGTLLVTSCPRFNVYGNDFGWGKPIGSRSGPPFSNGKLVVFKGLKKEALNFKRHSRLK